MGAFPFAEAWRTWSGSGQGRGQQAMEGAAVTTPEPAAPSRSPVAPVPPASERLRLTGGRTVLLRAIQPSDAEAEQAFVGRLSLDSRHKRFHIGLRQLSPSTLRQMTEVDHQRHVALVAQVLVEDGGDAAEPGAPPRLVADARYVQLPDQPGEAEFAIAVADDWQSLGLGRTLMDRLARHARAQGLRALIGDVLPENRRMLVLMRGLGAHTRPHPDGPQLVQMVYPL